MNERYWITGGQLAMLQEINHIHRKKMVDEIIDNQFLASTEDIDGLNTLPVGVILSKELLRRVYGKKFPIKNWVSLKGQKCKTKGSSYYNCVMPNFNGTEYMKVKK